MIMKDMAELIKENGYITPEIAAKNGISKYKFYKYVRENELEQVEHGIYISNSCMCFIRDVPTPSSHIMKHCISTV